MSQVVIGDILPYTQAAATNIGQTVFGTNWTANYPSDVVVYYTPINTAPNDVTQILAYPADYSVAFIGASQEVQVTLVTGAINIGDIVTITRQTPADRENLYTNTNFVPSMLNNDFGILTLVDQQAQLVNQLIGPRYNYSAVITDVVDTILPILGENQTWVKNSNNTAIIPYTLPQSGIAPADDTYVLLTPDSNLPNSLALSTLGSGFMVNDLSSNTIITTSITGQSNQISITNGTGLGGATNISIANNPIIPGTAGMGIPEGTTGQRVTPGSNISLRYNTTETAIEYYNGTMWVQLAEDANVEPGLINQLAYYAATGSSVSGLPTANNGVLITSNSGVPSISSTLPSGLLITNGKFNQLNDVNGNTMLLFSATPSAVNYIELTNQVTGQAPIIQAQGSDTNVQLNIQSKGTGAITFSSAALTNQYSFYSGTLYTHQSIFNFPVSASTSQAYTFPDATGTIALTSNIPTGAALTEGSDINVTLTLGGSSSTALVNAASITAGWSGQLSLARGGTNANLTASNGGIFYSTASAGAILAGTATANQILMSGSSTTPAWSTATYPPTTTINQLLYSSSTNTIAGLATANSSVLITSVSGVPSLSTTLPSGISATNMSLTTPTLGVATATSINFGGSTLSTYAQSQTWTPTFSFATPGNLSVSYGNQTGYYSRIGNIITAHFQLACTPTFTTASGNVEISGLPFAIGQTYAFGACLIQGPAFPSGTTSPFLQAVTNQSYFVIGSSGSATAAAYFTNTQVTSGTTLNLSGSITYLV